MLTSSGSRSSRSSSSRTGKDMTTGRQETGKERRFEDLLTLREGAPSIVYERRPALREFITILRSRDRPIARSPWKVVISERCASSLLVSPRRRSGVLHRPRRIRYHDEGRVGAVLRRRRHPRSLGVDAHAH